MVDIDIMLGENCDNTVINIRIDWTVYKRTAYEIDSKLGGKILENIINNQYLDYEAKVNSMLNRITTYVELLKIELQRQYIEEVVEYTGFLSFISKNKMYLKSKNKMYLKRKYIMLINKSFKLVITSLIIGTLMQVMNLVGTYLGCFITNMLYIIFFVYYTKILIAILEIINYNKSL